MSEELKTVHVVTSGCYSDKQIVGVYSDKERAAQHAAIVDDGEVTDWIIDGAFMPYRATQWHVEINMLTGDLVSERTDSVLIESAEDESYQWTSPVFIPVGEIQRVRALSVKSRDHALKLAAEHRQAILRERPPALTKSKLD